MSLKRFNKEESPWWVILLKVIAYAIGLILSGFGVASVADKLF